METGAFLTYEDIFRPHVEHALTTGDLAFLERTATSLCLVKTPPTKSAL